MPGTTVSLAPIPLARAPIRLLLGPLLLLTAGSVAAVAGVVVGGVAGVGLVAAGVVVDALAAYLALVLFSLRLDVEVAMLRLSWIGGERRYVLSRGAVTRVPLRGEGAASLRPRFGAIGWAMGPALLRRSEPVELIRLARSASVILVPTDRGRLGIAPASEQQLLTALGAAARVQQRLDEVALRVRPGAPPPAAEPARVEAPLAAATGIEEGRVLTGIERAMLEERLAAERAAALAAAEAEREALEAARFASGEALAEAASAPAISTAPSRRARPRQPMAWHRPAWLQRPRDLSAQQLVPFAAAAAPLVGALVVWVAAALSGRLELPEAQLRAISLALLATGPLAALAALLARTWYPRLLGLVVLSSLAVLVLVGRGLLLG
jgi:hypothetical protein